MITGKDLIARGFIPGPKFKGLLEMANRPFLDEEAVEVYLSRQLAIQDEEQGRLKDMRMPMYTPDNSAKIHVNIEAESELEQENVDAVLNRVEEITWTPTVTEAAIMPDACPTGPHSMPVGTVIGAENAIHPGWHSADVCCSLFASNFGMTDPKVLLDTVQKVTHFGPGGRVWDKDAIQIQMPPRMERRIGGLDHSGVTRFFQGEKIKRLAHSHFATQGDGNHFAYVGLSEVSGETWLITHHGSRGFGAMLYKLGMIAAERYRKQICPELHKSNAWIPYGTDEGVEYWDSLQVVREWTKLNHQAIHNMTASYMPEQKDYIRDQFWNEHNFVFKDGDTFYHAKGATPVYGPYLPDSHGIQIIPLNMAEPILFVKGTRTETNLGFAPHGAGRNLSRTAHKKTKADRPVSEVFKEETEGLDVRFWTGNIDISELPSAYKSADTVQRQMEKFNLATVVGRIRPYGTIMAGMWKKPRK